MFLIKELTIRNFRSHANSTITFDTGVNLISGRNGAGKTSILDAILVALYGSRPTGLKKEQLVRDGTSGYNIRLKFDLNGKEYIIERNSDGNTRLRGDVTIEGDSAVTSWVERNIGSPHIFTSAVYVKQGEIDEIIRDEESREKVIRRITRIEDFENAWKNMGKLIREFERERDHYKSIVEKQEIYKTSKEEKEIELKAKEEELKNYLQKKSELDKVLNELSKRLNEFERIAKNVKDLEAKKNELIQNKKALEAERSAIIKTIEDLKNRIKKLEMNAKICKEIESDAKKYIKLEELYRNLNKRFREIEVEISELKREKDLLISKRDELTDKIKKKRDIEDRLRKIDNEISNIKDKAEIWKNIELKSKRRDQIVESIGDVNKVLKSYELLKRAKEENEKLHAISEKLTERISKVKAERDQIVDCIKKIETASGICPICKRELSEEHKKKLLESYKRSLKEKDDELLKLLDKRKKISEKREKIESVLSKEEAIIKKKQLLDELKKLEDELKGYDLEELKKCYEVYESLNSERDKLKAVLNELEGVEDLLNEVNQRIATIESTISERESEKRNLLSNSNYKSLDEILNEMDSLRSKYEEWNRIRDSEKELELERERLNKAYKRLNEIEEELKNIDESLRDISDKIKEFDYDEEEHNKLKNEYLAKSKELSAIDEGIRNLKEMIESIKKDLERLNVTIEQIEDYKERIRTIEDKIIPELRRIRDKYRTYKNTLAETVFKEVEEYASKIFEEITDGKYSGIRLKQISERGKEKLKVFVIHNGKERDINYLSGGELIALGLAFRLALSSFMIKGRVPILILDEPTPFLDEERRKKLVEITINYLRRIPQVIIVTHDDELKDAADRIISVEYVGGVSKVYVED